MIKLNAAITFPANYAAFLQAEDAARALELRQQSNAAFKQGELHQALAWYWQAAAINPGDAALLNNISLACLKQGGLCQVRCCCACGRLQRQLTGAPESVMTCRTRPLLYRVASPVPLLPTSSCICQCLLQPQHALFCSMRLTVLFVPLCSALLMRCTSCTGAACC